MYKTFNNKNLIFILIGILIFSLIFPFSVNAQAPKSTVTFDLGNIDANLIKDRTITIWAFPESIIGQRSIEDIVKELKVLPKDEIQKRLGVTPFVFTGSPSAAFRILADLDYGNYVAFDEVHTNNDKYYSAFMSFNVPEHTGTALRSKLEISEEPGRVILKKVDENGNPLEGVAFRLYFHIDHPLNIGMEPSPVPLSPDKSSYDPNGTPKDLYTDKDGIIEVKNLPEGTYFFKEVGPLPGYSIDYIDNHFVIRPNQLTTLEVVNKKDNGGFNFIKISASTGKPLEGAKFVLMRKIGDTFVKVQRNGQDIVLVSDKDGLFALDGLEYGVYYLWEVNAPDGYRLLSEPIEFTVGDGTRELLLTIKNEEGPPPPETPPENPPETPPTPPTGLIPKTGDITILIMTLVGFVLIGLGRHLVREEGYE